MTSVKNLAIGLTTIATMGMLTVAAAAEPIGPREDFDPSKTEDRAAMHEIMQERHEERLAELEESNPELAAEIRERHEAHRAEREERREAVKEAVESGNYEAFVEALGEHVPEDMTEEKFGQIQEVHQLLDDGDKEGAKALAEEYGLERPFEGRGHGRGKHMFKRGMKLGEKIGEARAEAGEEVAQ